MTIPAKFEGREVNGMTIKVKPTEITTGDQLHHEQVIYMVSRCVVTDVQHAATKEGALIRRQVVAAEDAWRVEPADALAAIDRVETVIPGLTRAELADTTKVTTISISKGVTVNEETGEVIPDDVAEPDDDEPEPGPSTREQQLEMTRLIGRLIKKDSTRYVQWCWAQKIPTSSPEQLNHYQAEQALAKLRELTGDSDG